MNFYDYVSAFQAFGPGLSKADPAVQLEGCPNSGTTAPAGHGNPEPQTHGTTANRLDATTVPHSPLHNLRKERREDVVHQREPDDRESHANAAAADHLPPRVVLQVHPVTERGGDLGV